MCILMKKASQVFKLEGSNYQMGLKQGTYFKAQIKSFYDDLTHSDEFFSSKPFFLPKFLFFKLASSFAANKVKDSIQKHMPSQWQFLKGLSSGSKLSIKKILFLQAIDALGTQISNYTVKEESNNILNNCSAVGVKANRSSTGGILMIKNWDGPEFLTNYIIFRTIHPSGQNKFHTIGSGVVALAGINNGMNEKGLSIVYNFAYPVDIGNEGIPPMFLIRAALEECNTVEETYSLLERFPRLGGANYMVGDNNGTLAVIESSPSSLELREAGENGELDYLIMTNHYLTPSMQKKEIPKNAVYNENMAPGMQGKPVHKTSILRYQDASKILHTNQPSNISLTFLNEKIQSSHGPKDNPSEYTFCNHGTQISTGFGIMIDIKNKQFYAVIGKPCQEKMASLT